MTADNTARLGGPPENDRCDFLTYYDGTKAGGGGYRNYSFGDGRLNGAPLCSVCKVWATP